MSDNADTTVVQNDEATPTTCEAGTTVGLEDAVVQARRIERDYGQGDALVRALAGVAIDLQRGAYTAIMGPSGSGKSTLMHILAGLDRPTARQRLDRRPGDHRAQGARAHAAAPRQDRFHLPDLQPAAHADGRGEHRPAADDRRAQGRRRLGGRADRRPSGSATGSSTSPPSSSGGQQQRVAVARALASRPAVLFADEPTGNLDSRTGEEVLQLLRHSRDKLGQTIVMVTHDAHAATYADRIVFLKDGAIAHDCGRLGRDDIYDVIKSLEDV